MTLELRDLWSLLNKYEIVAKSLKRAYLSPKKEKILEISFQVDGYTRKGIIAVKARFAADRMSIYRFTEKELTKLVMDKQLIRDGITYFLVQREY